jgi:predicted enzyme related to lactoylglutathione lyase
MSERDQYPAGVPCWVETLQLDPQAALDFYGPLFDWEFAGPGPVPGDPPGKYFVARVRGRDVAGIGSIVDRSGQPEAAPVWSTYVRVDSADEAVEIATSAGGRLLDGPLDAPPAGRLAALADPMGATFCVWEAKAREGAQIVNERRAWSMSLLHTTDPERANAFYGAAFGWQPEPLGPPGAEITLWRLPGYLGGEPQQPVPRDVVSVMMPIGGDGAANPPQPHWSVDFWVADADATAEQAARLGGIVVVPPHDTPGFRNAVLADPSGAVFSISELRPAPRQSDEVG